MSNHSTGNIFPSLSKTLGTHGEALTIETNSDHYSLYTFLMGHDPAESEVDEAFRESSGTIGKVAEASAQNAKTQITVAASLLNEAAGMIPDMSHKYPMFNSPIRQLGLITLHMDTNINYQDRYVIPIDHFTIDGTVLDNGSIDLSFFRAAQVPQEEKGQQDFEESETYSLIARLGLEQYYHQHVIKNHGFVYASLESESEQAHILNEAQTTKFGDFLQEFFDENAGPLKRDINR